MIKEHMIPSEKLWQVNEDNYSTGCLLHYVYFQSYYKMIAIDLSKQQALDADSKATQQINFTGNLDRTGNNVFHYWRSERNHYRFFTRNCEYYKFIFI